jgi:ATP-dependent Clp protease adapter protein ClpS
MSSPTIKENTRTTLKAAAQQSVEWKVVLFNCDCHLFDTVVDVLVSAIRCSAPTASQLAQVADELGSAVVFRGDREPCENVANVIGRAGLVVKIEK